MNGQFVQDDRMDDRLQLSFKTVKTKKFAKSWAIPSTQMVKKSEERKATKLTENVYRSLPPVCSCKKDGVACIQYFFVVGLQYRKP
jgi:hypothetical protein